MICKSTHVFDGFLPDADDDVEEAPAPLIWCALINWTRLRCLFVCLTGPSQWLDGGWFKGKMSSCSTDWLARESGEVVETTRVRNGNVAGMKKGKFLDICSHIVIALGLRCRRRLTTPRCTSREKCWIYVPIPFAIHQTERTSGWWLGKQNQM